MSQRRRSSARSGNLGPCTQSQRNPPGGQPMRSSTKAMLPLMTCGGCTRSSQVSPRSRERNRRALSTNSQTTPSPAAATNTVVARAMGVALATGEGAAVDGAANGSGPDAGDVGTVAIVDVGTALGVAIGPDGVAQL